MKEGWEYIDFKDVFPVKMGKTPPRGDKSSWDENKETHNKWVSIADISNNEGKIIKDTKEYISDSAAEKINKVSKGSLLMSFKLSIGRMAFAGDDLYTNEAIIAIPESNKYILRFIYYYLLSYNWLSLTEGNEKVKGATLNKSSIGKIQLPVLLNSEQQRIVDYLDSAFAKIDAMKANAEKALNEAKALFQASLKEMLEPKEGWEEKKLQEVACDFSRGKSKHRPRNDKKLFGGNYPFIQTGEIRNANVYVTSHSSTYNEIGLSQSKLWPKDTVCITIAANIAEVAILKYPSCFPDSVIGFVADINKVDKMFVFYSLIHYQQELKKQGKGSAQDNINLGTFEKNRFPFPSLQEQQSIVETLDSLKSKVDRLQANYDKISQECDALKQAILRQVFE